MKQFNFKIRLLEFKYKSNFQSKFFESVEKMNIPFK